MNAFEVRLADFSREIDAKALIQLMQAYATDPMGGGQPIADLLLKELPEKLKHYPTAFSVIAWQGDKAVGLINCFETLSTFKVKPLINIHDVVVAKDYRGQEISVRMMERVEQEARARGCCKLTLEVLEGNQRAQQVYREFGFSGYELDEKFGQAMFWEKAL